MTYVINAGYISLNGTCDTCTRKMGVSRASQLSVEPTQMSAHSEKKPQSATCSAAGYSPENHHVSQRHMHVRPEPPKVKPFALRSRRSKMRSEEKRAMGIAESALINPATSSDRRKGERVDMPTSGSRAPMM